MSTQNEILIALAARRSCRAYKPEQITADELNAVTAAGTWAPTAMGRQSPLIVAVQNKADRDELSRLNAAVMGTDSDPFYGAPTAVLVLGDKASACAVQDASLVLGNMLLAASSLGLGSCYIGDITENCERQRKLLHLPPYVFPAVMLVFGFPTEQQKMRKKPERCALSHIVHENAYRAMDADELRDMLEYQCGGTSYRDWLHAFCTRKYNSDFAKEMTRSVAAYLRDFEQE